jgi:predicted lipoprotein with Yx(FWY)xxD motif
MQLHKLIFAAALAASFAPAAMADDYAGGAVMSSQTDLGEILTDANGMTLYVFDKDEPGVSNCYDTCAEKWPPLLASEGAMAEGDFTLVERNDGTMQWAYDGMPLYGWVNDVNPGDTTGDGVGGVWHVVVEGGGM